MKNFFLIISILCLSYGAGQAQNHVLNDILQAKTNGTGAIINDGIVTGYYALSEFGKNGSNTSTYRLDIFDQNLGPLSKKRFRVLKV